MEVGKLKNETLKDLVISEIHMIRDDILIRPSIGEDCSAISFGDMACVLTTDPITGSSSHIGKLAVHVCLNDVATSGAETVGLMLTLLCPVGTEEDEIRNILKEANEAANIMGVEIVGGHTEITAAVNRTVVSATAIGKTSVEKLIKTSGAKVGDYIYLTKQAGTEGTAIIASDKASDLAQVLNKQELITAQEMMKKISVVAEGRIGAQVGVHAMHDATEGGVLGAIYEMCEASGKGCKIHVDKINVNPITEKICEHFHINPLKLISSGTMVMSVDKENASALERALLDADIDYSRVGVVTDNISKKLIMGDSSVEEIYDEIESPEADELYKVIK
ncbi:AIR synthase family protein [Fusibacter bizertensis]